MMNAVKLLKQDHKLVSDLFEEFEEADEGEKSSIAERICKLLTVHAQIEEELLYPQAREALDEEDAELVSEAAVEHATAKDLIAQIEQSGEGEELWEAKVKVLGEYIKHHVKEEEGELFPKLQKTDLDLDELGEQLAERKSELMSEMGVPMEAEEEEEEEEAPRRSRSGSSSRGRGRGTGHRPTPSRARRGKSR
jgi:hemerythrin superfamily protein